MPVQRVRIPVWSTFLDCALAKSVEKPSVDAVWISAAFRPRHHRQRELSSIGKAHRFQPGTRRGQRAMRSSAYRRNAAIVPEHRPLPPIERIFSMLKKQAALEEHLIE